MFIGRRSELDFLEEKYRDTNGNFILIYGRRRIGKTALVNEFIKKKESIYLFATQEERVQTIKKFSQKVSDFFSDTFMSGNPVSDWDAFFQYLAIKLQSHPSKIIIAIDEVTYIIEQDKTFLSVLQKYYDMYFRKINCLLILTGSLVNIVYNEILDYRSPLYGRRTGNIELTELKFMEIREFFPQIDIEKLVVLYSIFGGVPYYLELLGNGQNPLEKFLNKNNIFYTDVQFILSQELRSPEKYFTILELIANGKVTTTEISHAMNLNSNEISPYIDKLISMKIISRDFPFLSRKRNSAILRIMSNYFNFYFRFVFPNQEMVETGRKQALVKQIERNMPSYISKAFERICIEPLLTRSKELFGREILEIGNWWGRNPMKQKGSDMEEIDIIGTYEGGGMIFGEVKWTNSKTGLETFMNLKSKSEIFSCNEKMYVIISKAGFQSSLVAYAETNRERLVLLDLDQMTSCEGNRENSK